MPRRDLMVRLVLTLIYAASLPISVEPAGGDAARAEELTNIEGLLVQTRWTEVGDAISVEAHVVVDIPEDIDQRRAAAAHLCHEAGEAESEACEANAEAALSHAPESWTLVSLPQTLAVPNVDRWGNKLHDRDATAATLAAVWLREKDFGSRCAPTRTTRSVAVVFASQLRVFDATHAAKLRRDLEGTAVFVASYPEYAAEADMLGVPSAHRVWADAPTLARALRRRGVALGALASDSLDLSETGVHTQFWQWALLDLALWSFKDQLSTYDIIVRARTDLEEHVPFSYAKLDPAPDAVHCHSDFVFYATSSVFLRVFAPMMVRCAYAYWRPSGERGRVLYEPLDWAALVESDLSGVKWWWFPLPEAVFGNPKELRWPTTPAELKLTTRDHLDELKLAVRGAPARLSARTDFTENDYFRSFNSEAAVALQVLNTEGVRLCAPPADLRLTRATEPSERRWGAFKHGRDGRWDAAGMPASEAVADASALARACASKNRSWVETGRGHVPCAFVIM